MRKDVIKSLIAIKQSEIPFDVIKRDIKLPINRNKIITVPGLIGSIESPKFPHKYTLSQIYKICHYFNITIEQLFISEEDFSKDRDIIDLLIFNIIRYGE